MKVRLKPEVDFELSNFDNDRTEDHCDAASHGLTAYKGAPHEQKFMIELLQYWKTCSCTNILLRGSVVHHCSFL